jgi:hypothetical protein
MDKDIFLDEHHQKLEENEDYSDGFHFAMAHYNDPDAIDKQKLTNELHNRSVDLMQKKTEYDKIRAWFEKQSEAIAKAEAQVKEIQHLRRQNKVINKLYRYNEEELDIQNIKLKKAKKERQKYLQSRNYYRGIVKLNKTITKKWWYRLAVKLGGTNVR